MSLLCTSDGRRFADLTDAEVDALPDDELERYLDYKDAEYNEWAVGFDARMAAHHEWMAQYRQDMAKIDAFWEGVRAITPLIKAIQ